MQNKEIKNDQNKNNKHSGIIKITGSLLILVIIIGSIIGIKSMVGIESSKENKREETVPASAQASQNNQVQTKDEIPKEETNKIQEPQDTKAILITEADKYAASYDYDRAIETLKSQSGYESDTELKNKVIEYENTKATCVEVNLEEVTHVFYHSLVVNPIKCFGNQANDNQAVGNNQWMTTIEEFKKITQEMYNRGYVLVSLHDIAQETTDASGNKVMTPGKIMLPPGKKAFVMSLDDLSYYHSYDGYGFASKLILDENGKVKNEYIHDDGRVEVGDFDVVPIMDTFIEEHPDASYRGAKGTIALTGYNGILGYRTDQSYEDQPSDLYADKVAWLNENTNFTLQSERDEAKKVADVMKAQGWEFASHTWGHLRVGDSSLEKLQNDTTRWKENIEPIVGPTDTIIFAHGEDLQGWGDYDKTNPKFDYFFNEGYRYFCNVDSNTYRTHFGDTYIRQGRRNLDGYRIYFNAIGEMDSVSDLFDAKEILDPQRPPVHRLGN